MGNDWEGLDGNCGCFNRRPVSSTQIECDCCYHHPADECVGVDVQTAAGKKHLTLCSIHAAQILQRLASEAGEHPALLEIIKKKEDKQAQAAVARGERVRVSDLAQQRGFKLR